MNKVSLCKPIITIFDIFGTVNAGYDCFYDIVSDNVKYIVIISVLKVIPDELNTNLSLIRRVCWGIEWKK